MSLKTRLNLHWVLSGQLKQLNDQTIIAIQVSLDSEWDHFSKWLGASFDADGNHSIVAAAVTREVAYIL
ncbi:MAG: hypothetical protein WAN04_02060 [Candidatus Udaeobacter sp.]